MYLRANLDHSFEDLSSVVVELGAGEQLRVFSTGRIPRPCAILVRGNKCMCKFYLRVCMCVCSFGLISAPIFSNLHMQNYRVSTCVWHAIIKFTNSYMMESDLC